ncbi:polysaccharide deacetylase family protein [Calidithermus timidus]|uniref:polysaccharide deacetylase family protein n=1 Tax=Calidithermus timidus TaxID=307124 RepID=UPI00037A2420|nr:polysaccharide deacetylase family protein [Calidithermus timidus]
MPRRPAKKSWLSNRRGWLVALVVALGGLVIYLNPSASPAPRSSQPPQSAAPATPNRGVPVDPQPTPPHRSTSPQRTSPPEPPPVSRKNTPTPLPHYPEARPQPAAPWADLKVANVFDPRIVRRVKPAGEARPVALTFDDGPWPGTTPAVLEILERKGIKATFFWVGRQLERYPDLARRVVAEGHAVGNHTYSHRSAASELEVAADELERTNALIEQVTGVRTTLFRPPGGHLENGLAKYALERGYVVVMWSALSGDTDPKYSAADIVNNVLSRVRPGSIVLLHDGGGDRSRTLAALPELIERLQAEGYRFVTVPQLLESGEVDTHPWATTGP